jgi:hypothetical protein
MSITNTLAYVATSDTYRPLLVNGKPVMVRDVPQEEARSLEGVVQSVDDDPLQHEVVEGDVDYTDRWGSKVQSAVEIN